MEALDLLRREAFVEAIDQSRQRPVVSIFGKVPWEVIASFDILPIRAYGIDYYVVEKETSTWCSMLNSTVEYYRRDKCPFMAVSSLYIVDDFCPLRQAVIQQYFDPVYLYQDPQALIDFLQDFFEADFDPLLFEKITEQSAHISSLILKIRQSDLPADFINQLTYYQQFIFDLEKRIGYLEDILNDINIVKRDIDEMRVGQLAGIMQHFKDDVMIAGDYCEGERHLETCSRSFDFIKEKYASKSPRLSPPDVNVNRCIRFSNHYVKYEGEK